MESAVPYSNLQLVDPETKWLCGSLVILEGNEGED